VNDHKLIEFMLLTGSNPDKVRQACADKICHGIMNLTPSEQPLYNITKKRLNLRGILRRVSNFFVHEIRINHGSTNIFCNYLFY